MATPAQMHRSNVVVVTFRRYRMSLGNGSAVVVVATIVFAMPIHDWSYLLWGLLAAETCLIGFWMVLSRLTFSARVAYGMLHYLGLVFYVMAAGKLHLFPNWSLFDIAAQLRDMPALAVASTATAAIFRLRGWRLLEIDTDGENHPSSLKRDQYSLSDFGKWFTLLCVVLGLYVSLFPQGSLFWETIAAQMMSRYYLSFVAAVLLPLASAAVVFLWLVLHGKSLFRRGIWRALALWVAASAVLLINTALIVGTRAPYDYYLRHEPLMLAAFAAWMVAIAATAYVCGWRASRLTVGETP